MGQTWLAQINASHDANRVEDVATPNHIGGGTPKQSLSRVLGMWAQHKQRLVAQPHPAVAKHTRPTEVVPRRKPAIPELTRQGQRLFFSYKLLR